MKTFVITGATSGVGAALAHHLAHQGHTVFALARNAQKLAALALNFPDKIRTCPCDVRDRQAVARVAEGILKGGAQIDVLINNAAIFDMRPFVEQSLDVADQILETNLNGTIYCTHAFLPHLISKKQGVILNIASVAGTRGIEDQAVYCASKHGMVGFGDALAQELKPHGVLVCTLCPGGIDTELWREGSVRYPGDISSAMTTKNLVDLVDFVLSQPNNVLFKKLIFFPTGEWH
ncbi:MAG: SDR family oxidoreductase [Polyangiaceae bacterium]|nr:SDR family oxidoreductase [Polyangiaceae bacterium]